MQKHVATFTKKIRKKLGNRGGGTNISTWLIRGVIEMSTFVYEGGRGGQKSPKNCPRGLCMPPKKAFPQQKSKIWQQVHKILGMFRLTHQSKVHTIIHPVLNASQSN